MHAIADMVPGALTTRIARCEKHGAFESRHFLGKIWSKCPACAIEATAAELQILALKKRANAQELWASTLDGSCIPERFQDRSLSTFVAKTPDQERALAFAVAYADGFDEVLRTGRCALFVGLPGTGKTHLAAGIGLRLMRRDNRRVLFTTVMRAIRSIKDTWSRDSLRSETQAVAVLVRPDLLILDEVGVQFGSETEKLILFDVLNERYERRRPTLLLSNLSVTDVRSYLGDRIFDRLREDGGDEVVFNWASHRGAENE
jgi:DNA replication protein DnaC